MFLLNASFWQVKKTKEKGFGVFAKKEIEKGTIIGDYLGKVIKTQEYDFDNDKKGLYLMYYTDQASIYPNLKKPGIHLFNHSCEPNCWIYISKGHTLFYAIRKINTGEELTISYLLSPKGKSCNPCQHVCKCNSKFCTKTMHLSEEKYKKWQEFQNSQKKKDTKIIITFNRNLPRLTSYPKRIPYNPIISAITNNQ